MQVIHDMSDQLLRLSDFIPYCLSVVSNEISQKIALTYQQQFGIDLMQWRVLAVLGEESHISAQKVSERTAMDKVAVSRAVKKLLDSHLLAREFAAEDKRRSILTLTDKGLKTYQEIVPLAKSYERRLIDQLSSKEVNDLMNLLAKLRSANNNLVI